MRKLSDRPRMPVTVEIGLTDYDRLVRHQGESGLGKAEVLRRALGMYLDAAEDEGESSFLERKLDIPNGQKVAEEIALAERVRTTEQDENVHKHLRYL